MALSFGFFNSANGDRKYNSRQISHLFDGMIADGVMAHVGTHFAITAGPGMAVTVGTGRAWFNHTWAENDSNYIVVVSTPTPAITRTDYLVLEIDERDTVRNGSIKILRGSDTGAAPTLTNTDAVHQHLMASIAVPPTATTIQASNITVKVGTSDCPFATSILESVSVDNLFNQWDAEFNTWFENLKDNIVVNSEISQLNQSVVNVNKGTVGVGDIVISAEDLVKNPNGRGTFLRCDGSPVTSSSPAYNLPAVKNHGFVGDIVDMTGGTEYKGSIPVPNIVYAANNVVVAAIPSAHGTSLRARLATFSISGSTPTKLSVSSPYPIYDTTFMIRGVISGRCLFSYNNSSAIFTLNTVAISGSGAFGEQTNISISSNDAYLSFCENGALVLFNNISNSSSMEIIITTDGLNVSKYIVTPQYGLYNAPISCSYYNGSIYVLDSSCKRLVQIRNGVVNDTGLPSSLSTGSVICLAIAGTKLNILSDSSHIVYELSSGTPVLVTSRVYNGWAVSGIVGKKEKVVFKKTRSGSVHPADDEYCLSTISQNDLITTGKKFILEYNEYGSTVLYETPGYLVFGHRTSDSRDYSEIFLDIETCRPYITKTSHGYYNGSYTKLVNPSSTDMLCLTDIQSTNNASGAYYYTTSSSNLYERTAALSLKVINNSLHCLPIMDNGYLRIS